MRLITKKYHINHVLTQINRTIYFDCTCAFTLTADGYLKGGAGCYKVSDQVNAYASAKMSEKTPTVVLSGRFQISKKTPLRDL